MSLRSALILIVAFAPIPTVAAEGSLQPFTAQEDAINESLTGKPGDAARGRALTADRQRSLCMLCHTGPFADARLQGNLAPNLAGVGSRLTVGQLRLRIVDMKRIVPSTIMPSYYRIDGLQRVASPWRGKPVLEADEIEDLVAYLATLKDE